MIKIFLFMVVMPLLFVSCGIYKYQFDNERKVILSKKGNPITSVSIYSVEETEHAVCIGGKLMAQYEAKEKTTSREFSLKDFSPVSFNCITGCPFEFEKGVKYCISVSPQGDRVLQPIFITIKEDGSLSQINSR